MTPDRSPIGDRIALPTRTAVSSYSSTLSAVMLTSETVRSRVATRLVALYGKGGIGPKGRQLGPGPLGADASAFRTADADADGMLNYDETKRYLVAPTLDLELSVKIPKTPQGISRVETTVGPAPSKGLVLSPTADGSVVASHAGSEVEFRTGESAVDDPSSVLDNQFKLADANQDGAVDEEESRRSLVFRRIFTVADRDGDARLTVAEMKAYAGIVAAAAEARVILTVSDRGVALFERVDGDNDGRLSLRELRAARSKLGELDRDGDGLISPAEVSRRFRLSFGRGESPNRLALFPTGLAVSPARLRGAPAWFSGMDRNRDGDVSPREFLGPPEHFRAFDADGDGLIDVAEAAARP
jgi:Ca2+-binding EF-hand superfamily protein